MAVTETLDKIVYSENITNIINTKFSTFTTGTIPNVTGSGLPSVTEFFQTYNQIFYSIPMSGSDNSHLGLITKSSNYIGLDIDALVSELNAVRAQNVSLKQQVLLLSNNPDNMNALNNITLTNS